MLLLMTVIIASVLDFMRINGANMIELMPDLFNSQK